MCSNLPLVSLPAGTVLHHGTDDPELFDLPSRGPSWFALDWNRAAHWAGWASSERPGPRRVITAETTEQLELLDTRERASWLRVAEALTGDPDATPWSVAQAARDAGYAGWLGRDEILLCWPLRVLRRQDMRAVTPDHPSAGAVRRRTR